MEETIRTAAISPLRQRLIDDMNVRRFSRATQHGYIRDEGRFATERTVRFRVSTKGTRHSAMLASKDPAPSVAFCYQMHEI